MKRLFLAGLALLVALGFVALGVWQVERRAWKLDLIERVEARIHAAPAPLPEVADWQALDVRGEEYRRVTAAGTFLQGRDTLTQALTARGAGFWVLSPFRTAQGVVLVNRGFVPSELVSRAGKWCAPPIGPTSVTGLLRVSEPAGGFLRSNDPGADRWHSRDVAAIADARGLGNVAPFFVDAAGASDSAANSPDCPVGGLTVVRFSNNHLVYALTWFVLAGLGMAAAFLLLRRRQITR